MQRHPPGVIGFSIGDIVRYIGFVMSLQRVERPEGTYTSVGQSVSIPENFNTIIRNMLPDAQWLWCQADDHIWERTALTTLLDLELDVVVPLIIRRGPPFIPVINSKVTRSKSHRAFAYRDIPTSGVFEVESAGSGGMLIRRHVLERIQEMQGHDRVFEVDKGDKLAEDYVLCRKIKKAGFKIHCCSDVLMGHIGTFTVWPEVYEGQWRLRFEMGRTRDGNISSFYWNTDQQED